MNATYPALLDKIRVLPADRIAEIEDFVDFITQREDRRSLVRTTATMSAPAFAAVWDNDDDGAYDAL